MGVIVVRAGRAHGPLETLGMATLVPFLMIALACVGIMYGCNLFEPAADYLGRNMRDGVKGATINAVGSSLPSCSPP